MAPAQLDIFSIAAAVMALLLAAGFMTARLLQPRLRSFPWWAAVFLLVSFWLATSTLRPEMTTIWLRWLSWGSLLAAASALALGLHRHGTVLPEPRPALLASAAAFVVIALGLTIADARPVFWIVLGAMPTALFTSWCSALAWRRGAWLEAIALTTGTATLVLRALFHPAGALDLFKAPHPPPLLRGALPPEGGPPQPIGLGQLPPPGTAGGPGAHALTSIEHALVVTLITIAALVLLAGVLVLRELKAEMDRMRKRSSTDALSGLLNRQTFEDAAKDLLARPMGAPVCMILFDIDHFKRINDTAGHGAGDRVIARLGHLLGEMNIIRASAGRIGGEEFAVALSGCALETARLYAESVRTSLSASQFGPPIDWRITTSAGLALHRPGESLEELMARADRALYAAKSAGRDRIMIAPQEAVSSGSGLAA